jgi:hypothetical protein
MALHNLPIWWLDNSRKTPRAYIRNVGIKAFKGRKFKARVRVDKEFSLGATIGGTLVNAPDVGTFLEGAKECRVSDE